ncbi:hypothetical protein AB0K51_24530 [Kitasatospora sp. NPDC049285]|uniref:hypothetical protein n=1 Tax=Kitasatospora sp. NPDC049285 TaxID=3157096 RepID=UPI00343DB39B
MSTEVLRGLTACQRPVVVALAVLPVVMVTAACLPAVLLLPALPDGVRRLSTLLTVLRRWTEAVLTHG